MAHGVPPARHAVRRDQSAPRALAAVTARVPVAEIPRRFGQYLDQVYAASKSGHVQLDGQNVFLYHPVEGDLSIVDASFGVGITAPFAAHGDVTPVALPVGPVAVTTHIGDYGGLRAAHQAIIDWCAANGVTRTGIRWEVYGHWDPDPSRLRTDVYHLLAE